MKKVKLKSGYEVEVRDTISNDMELIDAIVDADNGVLTGIPMVCKRLMTPEAKKGLYDHLRGEDGCVKSTDVAEALKEIFNGLGEDGKN